MTPDKTLAQTYVWHGEALFFVSTINRDSSAIAAGPHRFSETIVWECDPRTRERGALIAQDGALENSIFAHQKIVEHLHRTGKSHMTCPENEQDCPYFCKAPGQCRRLYGGDGWGPLPSGAERRAEGTSTTESPLTTAGKENN